MRNFKSMSIIIPCNNESGNIEILYNSLSKLFKNEVFELIFVDDGSKDDTLNSIKAIGDNRIKYISFSRNFGHQYALKAGLNFAKGDIVISMDGDMQHPPEIIMEMIEKWKVGFDIVYTVRDNSNTGFFKSFTSRFFYKSLNFLSNIQLKPGSADFRLIDKKICKILKNDINEYYLFYRGLVNWIGFDAYAISYTPNTRNHGKSKYSLSKMLSFALNGITAFSIKPLRLAVLLGTIISFIAFVYGIYVLSLFLFTDTPVKGWTSLILLTIFLGGVNMLLLGIIGEYLGKLYFESKKRPHYIIKETNVDLYE